MATLYKTDGTVETVKPARGNKWTLDELQQHVGGMIELMPAVAPLRMLFDEEGRVKQRPFNAAMAAARARGRRIGHIPFGKKVVASDNRFLELHPDEQFLLAEMRRMRADGATVREIARRLNASGFRTRRGGLWAHQSVVQLLSAHPNAEVA